MWKKLTRLLTKMPRPLKTVWKTRAPKQFCVSERTGVKDSPWSSSPHNSCAASHTPSTANSNAKECSQPACMSGGRAGGGNGADALLPSLPPPSPANSNAKELQASPYLDSPEKLNECVSGEVFSVACRSRSCCCLSHGTALAQVRSTAAIPQVPRAALTY